ncbi:MAG: hypothetical protein P1V36_00650 [Planctomycetota bacterium]|nr:hypothetical protein [Planctomycetota bacterium]
MRTVRLLVLLTAPALVALLGMPAADADDCGGGLYRGHPSTHGGRVSCNRSGTCYVRDRCHPSTRYVVPRTTRGCGCNSTGYVRRGYGPWSQMRGRIRSRADYRRAYISRYFLRRYPFCLQEGAVLEEAASLDVLLAIGDEDAGSARALDGLGRLDRGAARFHVGDYAGAKTDFVAALAKDPQEHRARLGLLLCGVVKSDWRGAAGELDTLAKAGELRAADRLEAESIFADATKLKGITDGLKETSGYRLTDAKAHTVTAWLLAGQGDEAGAKRFLKLAKRWGGTSAARTALEANLGMAPKPKPAPMKAPEPKAAPAKETLPGIRPPNPALHREIAQVTPRGS